MWFVRLSPGFRRLGIIGAAAALSCLAIDISAAGAYGNQPKTAKRWITAYYPAWRQNDLPPAQIDMRAITHLVYFALLPGPDGALDDTSYHLAGGVRAVRDAVHKAGGKVLICVGGANSAPAFRAAIASRNRAAFIQNIVGWVTSHGCDGVDIDMEPLGETDAADYGAFIRSLRSTLGGKKTKMLLTAAVEVTHPRFFLPLAGNFDQINLMTYDLSGPWDGWVTWYNSPLYNRGGRRFPETDRPLPSCASFVAEWLAAGIPASKLGLGVCFNGKLWQGASGPQESIAGVTVTDLSYHDIMEKYYAPAAYHWDTCAHAPYLQITSPSPLFISYDDERLCREKADYARRRGLGGIMIWEVTADYRPEQPSGERQPLLQAIQPTAPR